jgi:hypothetical protein
VALPALYNPVSVLVTTLCPRCLVANYHRNQMIYNANLISVHFDHFDLKDTLKDKDFRGKNTIVFRVIMDSNLIQLGYIYKTPYIIKT